VLSDKSRCTYLRFKISTIKEIKLLYLYNPYLSDPYLRIYLKRKRCCLLMLFFLYISFFFIIVKFKSLSLSLSLSLFLSLFELGVLKVGNLNLFLKRASSYGKRWKYVFFCLTVSLYIIRRKNSKTDARSSEFTNFEKCDKLRGCFFFQDEVKSENSRGFCVLSILTQTIKTGLPIWRSGCCRSASEQTITVALSCTQ